MYTQQPFIEPLNTPRLKSVFDQLVGKGKGSPCQSVARLLSKEGDLGLSFMELAGKLKELPKRKTIHATGKASTIFLCHPFLVHSAQPHRGSTPKFMAQPPLLLRGEVSTSGYDSSLSPVERAIRLGID
ncbi:hypothetical protein [Lunatimonas sp.]|uniref:hypothetical protein n=1 Tax=Lunatimonas sp. TaxID=2060141 RepID=UPI00263B9056|nr:hypothetical protein [Lunatimonas sp.]